MFKASRVAFLAVVLNLVCCAFAADSVGVGMLIARQRGAPARLVQTTHGISDLLKSARLRNDRDKAISSYRIGWAYVYPNEIKFNVGVPMNVSPSIKARTVHKVPDQAVPVDARANDVIFFVAEVTYVDGSRWQASNGDIEHDARRQIACRGDC